ncbi:hypothetical protein BS50DRAFT_574536 [Corynespora cassiicola Philippines]|uniref:Zn(2)-C6 fungal-type domain-containing protein n=1 Tax=Corynespora cassiicola Philippines TaxID=1448308 RepID=A0A2T2NL04_CORCC|nr:hypothetical protein BS50DRAFT_574536 [Corynespora cassiicola Philippines]
MARRSAGFVTKRAHTKSRAGCTTCKRKKVKCDESLPKCGYCALRKLECIYPRVQSSSPASAGAVVSRTHSIQIDVEVDYGHDPGYNDSCVEIPPWITPATFASGGKLAAVDLQYLHEYKTSTWRSLTVQHDGAVLNVFQNWVPREAISRDYLLYAILSISASHSNLYLRTDQTQKQVLKYREKAFACYNNALKNITSENYESLLVTALFMSGMAVPPELPCDDNAILTWISSLLTMMQGLRIMAGLKWATGIENLAVFPIFRRELRTLPPPPVIHLPPDPCLIQDHGPFGHTPEHPNPPGTYKRNPSPRIELGTDMSNLPFRPLELMSAGSSPHSPPSWKKSASWQLPSPTFLPPSLLTLLKSLVNPSSTGPIDLHRNALVPVLHALSPIFLSLYYYHLDNDFYTRVQVFPTFLMPEFLALVRNREPRALVIAAWWFSFMQLMPNAWWLEGIIPRVLQAISNEVMRCNDGSLMDSVAGAFKIAKTARTCGKEVGARVVFEGWDGVNWDDGPKREEQMRFEELVDLDTAC